MIIKVCGLARDVDIPPALAAGATHLGMIFVPSSPRSVSIEEATWLRRVMPASVTPVGVFKDTTVEDVIATAQAVGLTWVQLHGGFSPEAIRTLHAEGLRVIWATPVSPTGGWTADAPDADLLLLDTATAGQFGGTGESFSWTDAARPTQPFIVAGGLKPHNVRRAYEAMNAAGVDLSSGVEAAPGFKSHALLRALGVALHDVATPVVLADDHSSTRSEVSP